MALITPHSSQAGIAVANGGRAADYVGASAFMTPGQNAMPGALDKLAHGMDKLGGAVNEMLLDRQRMQNATDIRFVGLPQTASLIGYLQKMRQPYNLFIVE